MIVQLLSQRSRKPCFGKVVAAQVYPKCVRIAMLKEIAHDFEADKQIKEIGSGM